jgi:hypothetical protein
MKDFDVAAPYVRAAKSRRPTPEPGAARREAAHGSGAASGGVGHWRTGTVLVMLICVVGARLLYKELGPPRSPHALVLHPLGGRANGAAQHVASSNASSFNNMLPALRQAAAPAAAVGAAPSAAAAAGADQEAPAAAVAVAAKLIRGSGRHGAPGAPRPLKYPLWWHAPIKSGTGYGSGAGRPGGSAWRMGRRGCAAAACVRARLGRGRLAPRGGLPPPACLGRALSNSPCPLSPPPGPQPPALLPS